MPALARCSTVSSVTSACGGTDFSRATCMAENANDSASATMATGAERNWISRPASAGPPNNKNKRVAESLLLASRYCSGTTNHTKNNTKTKKKNTNTKPTKNATAE